MKENNNQRSKISEFLRKKENLKFIIVGGVVVGLVVIYLILSAVFSGPSEASIKMAKESERISAGVIDYLDGLPQTQDIQLLKLFQKGFSLYETGNYTDAIYNFNTALMLKNEDKEKVALLTLNGNSYILLNNPKEAQSQYSRALPLAEKTKDQSAQATVWGNLGLVYQKMGNLDSAQIFNKKAVDLYTQLGSKKEEAIQLSNLGTIF